MVDVITTEEHVMSSCLLYKWQMLLPFDVVEDAEPHTLHVATCYIWQMSLSVADGIATTGWFLVPIGRCYYQVADGIAIGSLYFNFSSEVLSRTSSHICGRWYLPIVLLRDALLTFM